jgi:hypothetical protein
MIGQRIRTSRICLRRYLYMVAQLLPRLGQFSPRYLTDMKLQMADWVVEKFL